MREGFDKEIDSLLRRTARASTGVRGNGAGESKSDSHLDADELAAFAEGALPEAARLNAVSHLADCGECRSLAVNLTSAAGVETELEKRALAAAASPSSSSKARESKPSRGWFATLFAPRTLGYAVPVLALCVVAAVSFIALRSRNGDLANLERRNVSSRPDSAAPQADTEPSSAASSNANTTSNANTASPAPSVSEPLVNNNGSAGASAPKPENKDAKEDAPDGSVGGAAAGEKAPGGDTVAAAPPPPPTAAKEVDDDSRTAAPAPTDAAKTAPVNTPPASKSGEQTKAGPPPPSAQNNDEVASNAAPNEMQKRAAQQRGAEPQSPDGSRNRAGLSNSASGGALAGSSRNEREARQQRDSPAARRGRSDEGAATESDRMSTAEESRSAAGHRFRREGNAWVDVNYKSSMSSTGVRRGTDQYRALVADIPEIGRVAEQLGGEIFVVVKGRAYHIR